MMKRSFGIYEFKFASEIHPLTDNTGSIVEDIHELPAGVQPNRYGSGPFCRFKLGCRVTGPGVYAITVGDDLRYIGQCENLVDRFGPNGYGHIAARNCHNDGQATNCKINSLILGCARLRQAIGVWFHRTPSYKGIEREVIDQLHPPWNGRQERRVANSGCTSSRTISTPTTAPSVRPQSASLPTRDDFRGALRDLFAEAERPGASTVDVNAGQLHRRVGGYPGRNHRMPVCCEVMRVAMGPVDEVVESPPSGKGATLTIRYRLPRGTAV